MVKLVKVIYILANTALNNYQAVLHVYVYESTSAIGTKKLLIACRFFDDDKYEYERSEIEWRREQ